jgi:hypothetical protein
MEQLDFKILETQLEDFQTNQVVYFTVVLFFID